MSTGLVLKGHGYRAGFGALHWSLYPEMSVSGLGDHVTSAAARMKEGMNQKRFDPATVLVPSS